MPHQFCPLVDPHIVWQGQATFVGGVATVDFPSTIFAPPENLAVLVSGFAFATEKIVNADGNMTGFTAVGYGPSHMDYIVISTSSASFCSTYL